MELQAARARYDERHAKMQFHDGTFPADLSLWAEKRSASHPYKYDEGVTIFMWGADLAPHDHFLTGPAACEKCSESVGLDEVAGQLEQSDDGQEPGEAE